jgi:hypothetical protein
MKTDVILFRPDGMSPFRYNDVRYLNHSQTLISFRTSDEKEDVVTNLPYLITTAVNNTEDDPGR